MSLFKKKQKKQGIIVNHGRGDIRKYPPAGKQIGLHLQKIEEDEIKLEGMVSNEKNPFIEGEFVKEKKKEL